MTRIHIVSLPHTLLTRDYEWCAYTAKVRRFATMLADTSIEALVYGPDVHDDLPVLEYVDIVTEADRKEWFGQGEWNRDEVFDRWDATDVVWTTTNHRAAVAIRERWQDGDLLGLIGGMCQAQIKSELTNFNPLTTEWGIGYSGVIPGTHRVYESYAWMAYVAGFYKDDSMQFFDDVIPNCFDPADLKFTRKTGEYLLFMGRPTARKGLAIVEEIAARSDYPVLVAGQPGANIPGTDYVGLVTGKEKAQLLAGARAALVPTTYFEPFGGVAVEAMMSGTPVITTDFGAFTETVEHGVTGYRCRMLKDFLDAVDNVETLSRTTIRNRAVAKYSIERGAQLYGRYLERLAGLYTQTGNGWFEGA